MKENNKKLIPYYQVARQALMNWKGLSEEEADKVISEQSFDKIEGQVWATGSMNYAIEGIRRSLDLSEQEMTALHDGVYEGENLEDLKEFKSLNTDPNSTILDTLSAVHDGWVKDNQKKFFARDKKYQHLPLELIGWEEAKLDLLFVKPIMEAMGIEIDESALEEAYNKRAEKFKEDKGIKTKDDLREAISRGAEFYPALKGQKDILYALQNQAFVSAFVLKENFQNVMDENSDLFDMSDEKLNRGTAKRIAQFARDFDWLKMIPDEGYHLSVEDKELCVENAEAFKSTYEERVLAPIFSKVFDAKRLPNHNIMLSYKENQRCTKDGLDYIDLLYELDTVTPSRLYDIRQMVENEKISKALETSEDRKSVLEDLLRKYGINRLEAFLSDTDMELLTEIGEEKIQRNKDTIESRKAKIDELTKREQLLAKLSKQEETLKGQEDEIKRLDRKIARLESQQK